MKNQIYLWILIVVIFVGALVFFTINSNKNNMPINSQVGSAENTPVTAATVTGAEVAKAGDVVSVNYTGKLANGTVFDSNVDPKFGHVTPFTFNLGAGQVIKGWDTGIVGMKVGDKKTLTLPPAEAYGSSSPSPLIPPNSTLIFNVELLSINK